MAAVTTKQMLSFTTSVQGNRRGYLLWFFALAIPGNALLFLFNVATNASGYRSTAGIWLELVAEFTIFVTAVVVAHRRCARLIHVNT
jgi:hypothetical protein